MYVCGITVYDYCHIGHARSMIVFDVVAKYLRYCGFEVDYVNNVTDIDDKIIHRANENKETCDSLTTRFIDAMHEDQKALGVNAFNQEPKATDYIADIVAMINTLIEKGYAYVADNGDVYYSVRKFKGYGKLSKRDLDQLRSGERIDVVSEKQDPLDFVLWKLAKPSEPFWPSPWGEGRPGWHSECSVMSSHCLGEHIDIHGGGMDLMFPHHENEIAQAEAETGHKFVNIWMHNGFLNINNEKMSKSLKNFLTIREIIEQHDAESVRYFYLSSHYRKPLNYSEDAIPQAHAALERFYIALRDLPEAIAPRASEFEARFIEAMNDDFNVPEALAVLFDLVRDINRLKTTDVAQAAIQGALLKKLGGVLGILQQDPNGFLQSNDVDVRVIEALIEKRNTARQSKDWAAADHARAELAAMGIELEDSASGTTWRKSV